MLSVSCVFRLDNVTFYNSKWSVYTIYTKVCGHPFKLVDSGYFSHTRCRRAISSTQPCNLHRLTLALEWLYWSSCCLPWVPCRQGPCLDPFSCQFDWWMQIKYLKCVCVCVLRSRRSLQVSTNSIWQAFSNQNGCGGGSDLTQWRSLGAGSYHAGHFLAPLNVI